MNKINAVDLCNRLRDQGYDARVDQRNRGSYVSSDPENIRADFVVIVLDDAGVRT